jgi:hypothetical protein
MAHAAGHSIGHVSHDHGSQAAATMRTKSYIAPMGRVPATGGFDQGVVAHRCGSYLIQGQRREGPGVRHTLGHFDVQPAEFGLGLDAFQLGLARLHFGLRFEVVELDERLALGHPVARAHQHLDHGTQDSPGNNSPAGEQRVRPPRHQQRTWLTGLRCSGLCRGSRVRGGAVFVGRRPCAGLWRGIGRRGGVCWSAARRRFWAAGSSLGRSVRSLRAAHGHALPRNQQTDAQGDENDRERLAFQSVASSYAVIDCFCGCLMVDAEREILSDVQKLRFAATLGRSL